MGAQQSAAELASFRTQADVVANAPDNGLGPMQMVDWEWLCAARAQAHASPLEELISNAGSEADEVVSVSASPEGGQWGGSQRHPPGAGFGASSSGGDGSRLSALLADTPRAKLDAKEAEAKAASKAGRIWDALQARTDALALALVAQQQLGSDAADALATAFAHYHLGRAYGACGGMQQAQAHCKRALEASGSSGPGARLRKEVHVLSGELLLQAKPPKLQAALQQFLKADGNAQFIDGVADPSIKVLCCQTYVLMANARLQDAEEARAAYLGVDESMSGVRAKAEAAVRKSEKAQLKEQLGLLARQIKEGMDTEAALLEECERLLGTAMEELQSTAVAEQARLEELVGREAARQHSFMVMIHRHLAHVSMAMASLYGHPNFPRANWQKEKMRCLGEVVTAYRTFGPGYLQGGLVAKAMQELGAALCEAKEYKEAHKLMRELMEVQEAEFADSPLSHLDVARAECLKLQGNVYLAEGRDVQRALDKYTAALGLFAAHFGDGALEVIELRQRIKEAEMIWKAANAKPSAAAKRSAGLEKQGSAGARGGARGPERQASRREE